MPSSAEREGSGLSTIPRGSFAIRRRIRRHDTPDDEDGEPAGALIQRVAGVSVDLATCVMSVRYEDEPIGGTGYDYGPRRRTASMKRDTAGHHSVYVVYLRNPRGDGKAGYYVGMTGLSPEQRFENHKNGIKAARIVKRYGTRLVPRLYAHLNPMTYEKAEEMEGFLAESLRKRGYVVYGGH